MRGCGHNFGIVHKFVFQLHDMPEFSTGQIIFPYSNEAATEVLKVILLYHVHFFPCSKQLIFGQIYAEQDTAKMPPELGTALSIDREPVDDPEIRIQALEAIYLIVLQV